MNSKKLFGMIVGVSAFVALVAGATFAWLTWSSTPSEIAGTTSEFTINYAKGGAISSTLVPSTTYSTADGDYASVSISRTSTSLEGTATLKLNVTSLTMAGTCVTGGNTTYTLQSACTGTWTSADKAKIHWAVYSGGSTPATATTEVATGTLASATSGNAITLFTGEALNTTTTYYFVYVWLDSSAGNEFIGTSFSGYISAEAIQNEM